MYSQLDIDALVESMCSKQQSKIDKQSQQKTTCEWYNEAIKGAMDAVKEFSNTYCSVLGTSSMLKAATYSTYSVSSGSDSKAVTVTASSSAQTGSYAVKVCRLAQNASVSSAGRFRPEARAFPPATRPRWKNSPLRTAHL
jgi:flagellar capping protein FliD